MTKLKSLNFLFICLVFIFSKAYSQPLTGLFWAVVKSGSTDTSYLLGTMHTYPKEVVEIPCAVKNRLERSKQLVLEINYDWKMGLRTMLSGTNYTEMNAEGTKMLSEQDWGKIKTWFVETKNIEEKEFANISSVMVASQLSKWYMKVFGMKESNMEGEIKFWASASKIPAIGLDRNIGEIKSWYDWYNLQTAKVWQEEDNMETILENNFYTYADLIASYALQDTQSLEKISTEEEWEDGLSLVSWRNHQWMKKLPKLMSQKSFLAVGAGHLTGPHGLIYLLRQEGFTLLPIPVHFGGKQLPDFIKKHSKQYQVLEETGKVRSEK
jgi:hypothetical protein